jgi:hypothetical protein
MPRLAVRDSLETRRVRKQGLDVEVSPDGETNACRDPRCPVCRAKIPGWDGVGGGVIGLIFRTVMAL